MLRCGLLHMPRHPRIFWSASRQHSHRMHGLLLAVRGNVRGPLGLDHWWSVVSRTGLSAV